MNAGTLVETIVAMVVLLLVFGIAVTIFVQTNLSSFSTVKIKAGLWIEWFASQTEHKKSFRDEEKMTDIGIMRKTILVENKLSNRILKIKFEVFGQGDNLIIYQYRFFLVK